MISVKETCNRVGHGRLFHLVRTQTRNSLNNSTTNEEQLKTHKLFQDGHNYLSFVSFLKSSFLKM